MAIWHLHYEALTYRMNKLEDVGLASSKACTDDKQAAVSQRVSTSHNWYATGKGSSL